MENITLPVHIMNEIKDHAVELFPNEACGILSGKDLLTSRIHRMTNSEPSPVSYFMNPAEQFRVLKDIRNRGEKMLAIYHSHPVSEAYPSAKDVELAFYPDVLYIIISLTRSPAAIRGFTIKDGNVTEKKILTL